MNLQLQRMHGSMDNLRSKNKTETDI